MQDHMGIVSEAKKCVPTTEKQAELGFIPKIVRPIK